MSHTDSRNPFPGGEQILAAERRDELDAKLVDAVEDAITQLVHIAKYGQNERVRLDAAKTIIDRVMGKVPDKVQIDAMAPIREFLEGVIVSAEVSSVDAEMRALTKAEEIRKAREQSGTKSAE